MVVSIVMITFNHELYIREAIESVLLQKTNFDFELIIANDCSPDNTDNIISDIKLNHPKASCIQYYRQGENIGMMSNFIFALKQAKGKYIALCDGDDYWIDENKLQKQVEFLESNPDYFAVTANTMYLRNGLLKYNYIESKESWLKTKFADTLYYKDVAMRIAPHTTTWLYRNQIENFPDSFLNFYVGDMPLFLIIAHFGKIKYIDEIVSIYRIHDSGAIGNLKKNVIATNLSHHFDMLVGLNNFFEKTHTKVTEHVFFVEADRFLKENPLIGNIEEVKKILNIYLVKLNRDKLTKPEEFKLLISYIIAKFITIKNILKTFLKKHIIKT